MNKEIGRFTHFTMAGAVLTAWGLFIAALIDIYHLSAFWTLSMLLPFNYILKYFLYRRVFVKKEKYE